MTSHRVETVERLRDRALSVHLRDLPWRETRDPWAVLVSEFMAQQTQVSRVIPKWHAFLEEFPFPRVCAEAPASAVIRLWAGLGYNRRALHLHGAATAITDDHEGAVPSDLDALLALPGIGPYTARAVLAFAFEKPVAVVDTNVGRVLARAHAGRSLTPREAQDAADGLLDVTDPWRWNQSIMEIGARWCRPSPDCEACPLAAACQWRADGYPSPDPAKGSAAVTTKQSRFEGSDRQGRGRIIAALRGAPVIRAEAAEAAGWPDDPDRAERILATLVRDGLVVEVAGQLQLAD